MEELGGGSLSNSFGMVNSGKTSAAEAARLFGLHRSSVSRLISHARAEGAALVG